MKNWKYMLAVAIVVWLVGLYATSYSYGVSADNSNIRLKEEVDGSNPVLNEDIYNYYMCVEDDYIVVYQKDRKTVYMDTGINVNTLDETEKARLIEGIPVENITTLYTYLENYTS